MIAPEQTQTTLEQTVATTGATEQIAQNASGQTAAKATTTEGTTSKAPAAAKRKADKKADTPKVLKKRDIHNYPQLYITTTSQKNNFFVVVTEEKDGLHRVVKRITGGTVGQSGRNKKTQYTCNLIWQKLIEALKPHKVGELHIRIKGRNDRDRNNILLATTLRDLQTIAPVKSVDIVHDAQHGGTKVRRARRV
jgi:ribosomal protein S11